MKSIDQFLDRRPSKTYNCFSLAREIWLHLTGNDYQMPKIEPATIKEIVGSLKRLQQPETPCIAVMQRDKLPPHIGIYIDGSVVHLTAAGVEFRPIIFAKGCYRNVRYYK